MEAICEALFDHVVAAALAGHRPATIKTMQTRLVKQEEDLSQGPDDDLKAFFLHLLQHLSVNEECLIKLLVSPNNQLFVEAFRRGLKRALAASFHSVSQTTESNDEACMSASVSTSSTSEEAMPRDFVLDFIAGSFIEGVLWWVASGMRAAPETVTTWLSLLMRAATVRLVENHCEIPHVKPLRRI